MHACSVMSVIVPSIADSPSYSANFVEIITSILSPFLAISVDACCVQTCGDKGTILRTPHVRNVQDWWQRPLFDVERARVPLNCWSYLRCMNSESESEQPMIAPQTTCSNLWLCMHALRDSYLVHIPQLGV